MNLLSIRGVKVHILLWYHVETWVCKPFMLDLKCRNLSLGFMTKAWVCKGVGQERSLGVTSHAPKSVREHEGMNIHTPKWAPILRIGVLMGSQIFKERLQGSNPFDWRFLYIIEKLLKCKCLKWARMTHLDTSNASYGQKKRHESNWQFDSWPLKVRNRPDFLTWWWHATCHWKALDKDYTQFCFKPHFNRRSTYKVMDLQSCRRFNLGNFGSPRTKCHLGVSPVTKHIVYYKGEGGGFLKFRPWWISWVQVCPWLILAPKVL
jgi:hypothetical protein